MLNKLISDFVYADVERYVSFHMQINRISVSHIQHDLVGIGVDDSVTNECNYYATYTLHKYVKYTFF